MSQKTFIVPHDFTSVSDIALEHAIATAKPLGAEILLLHIVENGKEIADVDKKLKEVISTIKTDVKIVPSVRIGNIFDDIGDFASEHQAELIFIGTHGVHGWQHLTGMNMLKVISNSAVPFIVVQEKSVKETGYDDIVVPLSLDKETKQKLAIVASLAKYFKSRVHIVTPEEKDEFFLRQTKANIVFAQKYFSERNIEITSTVLPSNNFDKEVIRHSVGVNADLIAIMNLNKSSVFGVLSSSHEEYIITNDALIPVLLMNPLEGMFSVSADYNG